MNGEKLSCTIYKRRVIDNIKNDALLPQRVENHNSLQQLIKDLISCRSKKEDQGRGWRNIRE